MGAGHLPALRPSATAGPYEDPDRTPAATRYLTQVDPEGTADIVVDLHYRAATARGHGRHRHALLVLADARRLPLPSASVDGAFAAGLLPHLPDPGQGLAELARVIRPGGRLVLFHPSGRAALAARHGRRLREDDLLAPNPLRRLLRRTGWWLDRYDDGPNRFLATDERVPGPLQSQDA